MNRCGDSYEAFIAAREQLGGDHGFAPLWLPDALFPFQRHLVEWSLRRGRAALLEDCGLGKSVQELTWAENVARHTGGRVLVLTPLAVGRQMVAEGEKFGIECSRDEGARISVANHERLHHFSPDDFAGVVADEASILKSFDGRIRQAVTEFMRRIPFRLLGTATAAPNDANTSDLRRKWRLHSGGDGTRQKWRFKGHAEGPFWRWVCSWARACRKPSDLGFDDAGFVPPPLVECEHVVKARKLPPGMLFPSPAVGLSEEREERRRTIAERCEKAAELVDDGEQAVVWCHLNDEGNRLADMLGSEARQIKGATPEEEREEIWSAFTSGQLRIVVLKPKVGAWGLNLQNCAHVVSFTSHSYEQDYQQTRRCWRFGQKRAVRVDRIATEGEAGIAANLRRKSEAAERMFSALVANMNDALRVDRRSEYIRPVEVPAWL